VKLAARWEVDTELEALRNSVVRVWDLVLDNINGLTSLAASLSIVVELRKARLTLWLLTGSTGGPDLRWLPPCHISRS
jgi:hypothetical protein